KNDFGEMLALLLLVSVITFFGLLLCVIPGVFLWVPLSIAPAVLIIGRTSITGSISDAYNLIKNNWWTTFGSLLVVFILMYIISFIFKVPMFIYMLVKTMVAVQEGSAVDASTYVDWVYIALNVVAAITQYLLASIIIVATAFIYFDLNEKKNFTGTYETISNLGSSENK
ncbi:MAG TPA: hypothetical protein VFI78_05630, partial [Salinimicrobium sp.]|nr:hypothetical protein [Salinimicrobium sp.]